MTSLSWIFHIKKNISDGKMLSFLYEVYELLIFLWWTNYYVYIIYKFYIIIEIDSVRW